MTSPPCRPDARGCVAVSSSFCKLPIENCSSRARSRDSTCGRLQITPPGGWRRILMRRRVCAARRGRLKMHRRLPARWRHCFSAHAADAAALSNFSSSSPMSCDTAAVPCVVRAVRIRSVFRLILYPTILLIISVAILLLFLKRFSNDSPVI